MFKRFVRYYRPHLGLLILDLLSALLVAGIDLIFPSATRNILNVYIPKNNLKAVYLIGIVLLIFYILRTVFSYIINYWGHMMGARIERDMRKDLFYHLEQMDDKFFDENKTGVLMSNLTNHLHDISEMSHHVPEDLFISVIMLIGSFTILCFINVPLTLIIFAVLMGQAYFAMKRRKKMRDSFRSVRTTHGELNSRIESSLAGIRLTKAYNNEQFEVEKFENINEIYASSWTEAYRQMAIFSSGNELFNAVINLILLVVGAIFVSAGDIDSNDLLAYFLYISFLTRPVNRLVAMTQQIQQGFSGFEKFISIIDIVPSIKNTPDARPLVNPKGKIEFRNVSFSYQEDTEEGESLQHVLSNFNLIIEPGKKIAIIGETGVGKSTISRLIPRFYEVNEGEILIDDVPIKQYELSSLRRTIGHVQQDVFIFYGTIKDNILYGKPDATMEEIIEAAKRANIHDFIMSLEEGYDTITGERGVKLSGGQKQRIAIARLFLKQPQIVILDEATSSLDNATERYIQASFDKLTIDKTSIIIAHRLSTIRHCDEIIVLGKEGIIERGNHDQLIVKQGVYYQLLLDQ